MHGQPSSQGGKAPRTTEGSVVEGTRGEEYSGRIVRVVQYCDIMRFMILCVRHHKLSPHTNPLQNSNNFVLHKERDTS